MDGADALAVEEGVAVVRRPGRVLRSRLRHQVEATLGPLCALPQEGTGEDSPLWRDWGAEGPFQVRLGRGECAS